MHHMFNFQCYTVDDLLAILNLTSAAEQGLSKVDFEALCPVLLQQVCLESTDILESFMDCQTFVNFVETITDFSKTIE